MGSAEMRWVMLVIFGCIALGGLACLLNRKLPISERCFGGVALVGGAISAFGFANAIFSII